MVKADPQVTVHIFYPGVDQCTQVTDTQERSARPHGSGRRQVDGGVWDAPVVVQGLLHDVFRLGSPSGSASCR